MSQDSETPNIGETKFEITKTTLVDADYFRNMVGPLGIESSSNEIFVDMNIPKNIFKYWIIMVFHLLVLRLTRVNIRKTMMHRLTCVDSFN